MHKETVLDNGLKVITSRLPDVHSLSVGLWIKTGGRYETPKNQGISHFMEHMLFKGTKKRSCQQIKQAIEEKGGAFNAFTSEECVCYYVKILSRQLPLACDVLSDMVLNSVFKAEEIEKERKVIFEEIRMYLDLPMHYVNDILDELLWPDHPLGLPLVGTYNTVGAISRKDLNTQKDTFYVPNNIIAVACGDIDHDEFAAIMKKIFNKRTPVKQPAFKKAPSSKGARQIGFFQKDTEQTHLCLGFKGLSRKHPLRFGLSLLNIILGGNMSSRLFNEIREKRSLAYEIGSSAKSYSDTGSFFVHAGIDNKKLKDAVSIMIRELYKTRKYLVSKRELDMAKEYFKSGLLMALESTMSNMLFLGEQLSITGKIITKDKILDEIEKVDADMIKEVAERLFNPKALKLAVIGPKMEEERFSSWIKNIY